MISAVQEQERQRQRARSAASGQAFSVPLMAELGAMQPASFPSAPSCTAGDMIAPSAPGSTAPELGSYLGRSVGTGQCVALVKAANPSLGPSSGWAPGASVQGNTSLTPGTPIATFDGTNKYANATDGSSHAAIYLGQDHRGLLVMDQWAGSGAAIRTIPWSNPGAAPANTGSAFRVVRPA